MIGWFESALLPAGFPLFGRRMAGAKVDTTCLSNNVISGVVSCEFQFSPQYPSPIPHYDIHSTWNLTRSVALPWQSLITINSTVVWLPVLSARPQPSPWWPGYRRPHVGHRGCVIWLVPSCVIDDHKSCSIPHAQILHTLNHLYLKSIELIVSTLTKYF